jgi:urea transport system substrate-binding protein
MNDYALSPLPPDKKHPDSRFLKRWDTGKTSGCGQSDVRRSGRDGRAGYGSGEQHRAGGHRQQRQSGILHSSTGTMAISETGSIQAEKLAIEQINASGGVLGRKIEYVQEDGASDWPTFAEKARKLLVSDKVAAIFGGWTSASRKAMLPVLEQYNGMLYYPTFYEGLEQSPNVIYTGQKPRSRSFQASTGWSKTSMPNRSIFSVLTISGHVPPTKLPVIILKSWV